MDRKREMAELETKLVLEDSLIQGILTCKRLGQNENVCRIRLRCLRCPGGTISSADYQLWFSVREAREREDVWCTVDDVLADGTLCRIEYVKGIVEPLTHTLSKRMYKRLRDITMEIRLLGGDMYLGDVEQGVIDRYNNKLDGG